MEASTKKSVTSPKHESKRQSNRIGWTFFGSSGGEDGDVVVPSSSSKKSPSKPEAEKGWFSSFRESISKATSSVTNLVGSIGNVFKSKESEKARQQREAREAAEAEANRKAREEAARKKAIEDRERREREERLQAEELMESMLYGDPRRWRERYNHEDRAKRIKYDLASLMWDASTFVMSADDSPQVRPPSSKLRIFCSSTFTDTMKERNQLLGPVYKKIRREAERRGVDFSFIDMRYGVRDENTLDHKTWEACKAELLRCKAESAGLFFLSLQGSKYGYQCLPKYIPRKAFEEKIYGPNCDERVRQHAEEWYLLDENALSGDEETPNGRYCLKNLARKQLKGTAQRDGLKFDNSYWDVMEEIRLALDEVKFDPETSERLTIGQCVTEWEFVAGSLTDEDCKRAYWLYRDFSDAVWPEGYDKESDKFAYWDYQDTHITHSNEKEEKGLNDPKSIYNIEKNFLRRKNERLNELKESMTSRLGNFDKIHRFPPLAFESVKTQDLSFQAYINRFTQKTEELLTDNIDDISATLNHWTFDGCGVGIPGEHLSEFCHHVSWAKAKISTFEGREELIAECIEHITRENRVEPLRKGSDLPKVTPTNAFEGIALSIVGVSGSGKTALVSRVAQAIKEQDERDKVQRLYVLRYCGTSTASTDGLSLVQSICRQIIASTSDPVEPLQQGSKVEHDDQGYGADDLDVEWTRATITKCHKNGTFDLLYDEAESAAEGEQKELAEKYIRLNQTRDVIRLRRDHNFFSDFVHVGSDILYHLAEGDDSNEIQIEKEKKGAAYNPLLHHKGQMWLPGKIVKVHCNATYDIVYQSYDGLKNCTNMIARDQFTVIHEPTITNPDGSSTQNKIWDFSHIPENYDSAVSMLHKLLARYPVVLIIDSLDQLTNNYKERSEISFLRGVRPHVEGRIIVTTLPDIPDNDSYLFLCQDRLDRSNVSSVTVQKLDKGGDVTAVHNMAKAMLRRQKRQLTEQQWTVFDKAVQKEATALYINLAVNNVMSKWNSFTDDLTLIPTVEGIIGQIFDNLERDFGKVLVRAVLIILTLSVDGVSDVEMQDLLSIDDHVLNFVFQYSSPDIKRLPYHVWLRIRASLGSLLVEKEGGCLAWYHRQLREVGRKRFSEAEKVYYSGIMGNYFGNLVPLAQRNSRLIKDQPWVLNSTEVFLPEAKINRRRCIEASRHLIKAGLFDAAIDELCSIEALYANTRTSRTHCFEYLRRINDLNKVFYDTRNLASKRGARLEKKIQDLEGWYVERDRIIDKEIQKALARIRKENPKFVQDDVAQGGAKMAAMHDVFVDLLRDARKAFEFQDICYNDPSYSDKYNTDPDEIKVTLHNQFKLADIRNNSDDNDSEEHQDVMSHWEGTIVGYLFETSHAIIEALGDRGIDDNSLDEDDVSFVATEEDLKQDSLQLLLKEREDETLDCDHYARHRIMKLKYDMEKLTTLRLERNKIISDFHAKAVEEILSENSFVDRAAIQKFMLDHLGDTQGCQDFIKKHKDTGRFDNERAVARAKTKDINITLSLVRKCMYAGRGIAAYQGSSDSSQIKITTALNQKRTDEVKAEKKKKSDGKSDTKSDKVYVDMDVELSVSSKSLSFTHELEMSQDMDSGDSFILGDKSKMIFVDIMVLFAELIIKALGEHWLHNEGKIRHILLESNQNVFKERDRKILDILEEKRCLITAENTAVDPHNLEMFLKYTHKTFDIESIYKTITQEDKEYIDHKYPLRVWRGGNAGDVSSSMVDGTHNASDHIISMSKASTKVIKECGIAISNDIEVIFHQRFSELEEFTDVFRNYLRLGDEIGKIQTWFEARDHISDACIHDMLIALNATYTNMTEADCEGITKLLNNHFKDIMTTKETKGSIEGDMQYAYVGEKDEICRAFDDIIEHFTPRPGAIVTSMSERMLAVADKILGMLSVDSQRKEKKYNQRLELLISEREECESLFRKYRMTLLDMETLHKWQQERDTVIDTAIAKCIRDIEAMSRPIEAKASLEIFSYLKDSLSTLNDVLNMKRKLEEGEAGKSPEDFAADLDRRFTLRISSDIGIAEVKSSYEIDALSSLDGELNPTQSMSSSGHNLKSPSSTFSSRLRDMCDHILMNMRDSAFVFAEADTSAAVMEINDKEMESLGAIFQHYRNPRISHLRKFEHYHRLLQKEMTNISLDPIHNVYLACERQPYLSSARKDFLTLFKRYKCSKKVLKFSQATNKDLVVPLYRSIGGLPYTFGPLQSMFGGHRRQVHDVAVSADGSFLVSCGEDTTIRVWHSISGNCELTLEDHKDEVYSVVISNDMKVLISASKDKTVKIWERKTGKMLITLFDHTKSVRALAVSRTESVFVSGSEDCSAIVWGLEPGGKGLTGERRFIIPHQYPVMSLCFSYQGDFLFTGSGRDVTKEGGNDEEKPGGEIGIFSAASGEISRPPLPCFSGPVGSIEVSRDNTIVAASTLDIYFILYDMDSRELVSFKGHDSVVTSVDITEGGTTIVSGSWDNTLRVWDRKSAACTKVLQGHYDNINAVTISGDSQTCYSAGEDELIAVWDLLGTKELLSPDFLTESITRVCASEDGSAVAALIGFKLVYLWSVATGSHLASVKSEHGVSCLCLSPNGKYICLGLANKEVHIWSHCGGSFHGDGKTPILLHVLTGHHDVVTSLCCTETLLLSGSADKSVRVYDIINGVYTGTKLIGHTGEITAICVSPAPDALESVPTREASFRNSVNNGSNAELLKLTISAKYSPGANSRSRSPGSGYIGDVSIIKSGGDDDNDDDDDVKVGVQESFNGDGSVTIGTQRGRQLLSSKYMVTPSRKEEGGQPASPETATLKAVDQFIVTGSDDSTACVWDMHGRKIHVLGDEHTGAIRCVCIDHSRPAAPKILTASDDDSIKIWHYHTGKLDASLNGHQGEVRSISISSDGKCIISGSDDKTVKLWDAVEDKELLELKGHAGPVQLVKLDPSGSLLLTSAKDSTIKAWKIIARNKARADIVDDFHGSIRQEALIKKDSIAFRERVLSKK